MAYIEPSFDTSGFEDDEEERVDIIALALQGENLAEHLDDHELATIAQDALDGMEADKDTMKTWLDNAAIGRALASMMKNGDADMPEALHRKNLTDWGADAKFPMVAMAAMQYNARAYPAIADPESPVKIKVWGEDKAGLKAARAERVREFMGYQLATGPWEAQIDSLTIRLPLEGAILRKVWHDKVKGLQYRNVKQFYLDNNCDDFKRLPRLSEPMDLYEDEIVQRVNSGRFIEFDYEEKEDSAEPHEFVEQYCRLDLDDDGYSEPYIIVVHKESKKVCRIEANYRADDVTAIGGKIISIMPREYYVLYNLMPSFDGTLLGWGLGAIMGNLSQQVDGALNRLMDSGTLASSGGGFIGQGLNPKNGTFRVKIGEWKTVNAPGAALRDSIVPLPAPEPSAVLFQALGLLIEAGREIGSVKDVLTGDIQANVQPTTLMAMIEQGEKVFSASYRRTYRSLRTEFALIAEIDAETVDDELYNAFHDPQEADEQGNPIRYSARQDFNLTAMDVMPVADPREVTNTQKMARAQLLRELARDGLIDPQAALRRVLEVTGIEDVDELIPQPSEEERQMQAMQQQLMQAMQNRMLQAQVEDKEADVAKKRSETDENRADAINKLMDAQDDADRAQIDQSLRMLEAITNMRETNERIRLGRLAAASGNGTPA